jgi:hypothetical protein
LVAETGPVTKFEIDSVDMGCNGQNRLVIDSRICTIPVADFRSQYALDYPNLIFAKIRSRNVNGWSVFSDLSISSAMIMTEPVTMAPARRSYLTDQYHIHIEWDALEGDEVKGSIITSYYLQWDKGTSGAEWFDLVGLTTYYLQLDYTGYFGDIVQGESYKFRLKAQNLFGFSVEWSPIVTVTANSKPNPVDIVTTSLVNDADVRIQWVHPADNFSPLSRYEILIQTIDGDLVQHDDCTGLDPSQNYCDISIYSLRIPPFNLEYESLIQARVRAQNSIGWGSYSQLNLLGLSVFIEPEEALAPSRGQLTTEEQIHVVWSSDVVNGGSPNLSFNLQWTNKNDPANFQDLIGDDSNRSLDTEHLQTVQVEAGETYLFRVRALNAMGWGDFSDEVEIVAAEVPAQPIAPTTQINNIFVRISWTPPDMKSSPITAYEVLIKDSLD